MTDNLVLWEDIFIKMGIGITMVFTVLTLLVFAFIGFSKLVKYQQKVRLQKQGVDVASVSADSLDIPAEVAAAIGLSISLHFSDFHDNESNVITIKRIERRYSPWNSKIYGLNNLHR